MASDSDDAVRLCAQCRALVQYKLTAMPKEGLGLDRCCIEKRVGNFMIGSR